MTRENFRAEEERREKKNVSLLSHARHILFVQLALMNLLPVVSATTCAAKNVLFRLCYSRVNGIRLIVYFFFFFFFICNKRIR